jgi:hypothetical protein
MQVDPPKDSILRKFWEIAECYRGDPQAEAAIVAIETMLRKWQKLKTPDPYQDAIDESRKVAQILRVFHDEVDFLKSHQYTEPKEN